MKRCATALCWVAMTWANTALAQTRCVVADMETHRPLKGVRVKTDTNTTIETDFTGTCILPATFKSLTFVSYGHMRRKMNKEELTDTVLLLPTMLNEVVIYGKAPKPGFDVQEAARQSARIGASMAPGGFGFDFFRMFDKRTRRPSKKEREMNERILKTY